jgi:ribonucleotide reductase beta subunit family protein with ferritin-like domain
MKHLLSVILFLTSVHAYSYQPKLISLGTIEHQGQVLLDTQAHKTIRDSFKQAVIYEKYAEPIKVGSDEPYQSVIKQLIVDCKTKTIAIRGADYFAGKTSNSKLVKNFDHITLSHDGETGAAYYSFDDLEFKPLNQDKFYTQIYGISCK